MKSESKHELAAAKQTLASLEATSADAASDIEVYELGQLLRESSATELPAADPALREQLIANLVSLPDSNRPELKKQPSKQKLARSRNNRVWAWAFCSAATLTAAVGGTLWWTAFDHSQHATLRSDEKKSSVKAETSWNDKDGAKAEKEKSPVQERGSKSGPLPKLESKPKNAQRNYDWSEGPEIGESISSLSSAERVPAVDEFSLPGESPTTKPTQNTHLSFSIDPISSSADATLPSPESPNQPDLANLSLFVEAGETGTTSGFGLATTERNKGMGEMSMGYTGGKSGGEIPIGDTGARFGGRMGGMPIGGTGTKFGGGMGGMGMGGLAPSDTTWNLAKGGRSKYEETRLKYYDSLESSGWRYGRKSPGQSGGEQYDPIVENTFIETVGQQALSTFSIDVDTASYSNMRRFINSGRMPPPNSVRIEELVNYFQYDYPQPEDGKPFRVAMEVAECPWQPEHRLVRVGIKGKDVHRNERPASNLVFLLDVSGSMSDQDKLPLLQRGLQMMLDRLSENDRVSIVTYAGNAGVRLEPTSGDQKFKIRGIIDHLSAGGSTNGSAGIEMAYDLAVRHFIKDGTNRVVLATDGDLNVGVTDDQSLVKLIKGKASEGVFLTVLGFGTGNLKDSKMEKLADNGNGVYAYIDSLREAHKVLIEQMSASLVTIVKDVKLQVEFNPTEVKAYRLLGYENRKMANADFANDKKDAGEIGAGHTVTALYEIVPAGTVEAQTLSANLKYQQVEKEKPQETKPRSGGKGDDKIDRNEIENKIRELEIESHRLSERLGPGHRNVKAVTATIEEWKSYLQSMQAAESGELLTLAIRYKLPDASESEKIEFTLADSKKKFYEASGDFRFAAAVASFGMLLRNSQFSGNMDLEKVENIASKSIGEDPSGYRIEFVDLVRQLTNAADE